MVDYFSVEYKTFIIIAESLNTLPQVNLGLSYILQEGDTFFAVYA